jgi:hypothetical protein
MEVPLQIVCGAANVAAGQKSSSCYYRYFAIMKKELHSPLKKVRLEVKKATV